MKFIHTSLILLLSSVISFSYAKEKYESNITKSEIKALEQSGAITQSGNNSWKTKNGLYIRGKDPKGLTRLEHIMRHSKNIPNRDVHSVFDINKNEIISLLDETWVKAKKGELKSSERGGNIAYIYDTGRAVGYLGGVAGEKKKHPKLKSVRLVVKKGSPEVITFFPE